MVPLLIVRILKKKKGFLVTARYIRLNLGLSVLRPVAAELITHVTVSCLISLDVAATANCSC